MSVVFQYYVGSMSVCKIVFHWISEIYNNFMSDVGNFLLFLLFIISKINLLQSQPYSFILNSYLQPDSFIGLVHHDLTFCDSMMFIPLSFKFNFDAVKIDIFLFSSQLFVYYFIFFVKRLLLSKIICIFANAIVPFAHDWSSGIRLRTVVWERTVRVEAEHILLIVRYISYD